MPSGMLELMLIGATGIKNTDFFGKSDPYAVMTCWRQSFRSTTAKNQGSNPIWNQKFHFFVEEGVTELFIKLYDEDTFTGDDFIGSCKIPLEVVFKEKIVPPTSYAVIRPSGRVKGSLTLSLAFDSKDIGGSSFVKY